MVTKNLAGIGLVLIGLLALMGCGGPALTAVPIVTTAAVLPDVSAKIDTLLSGLAQQHTFSGSVLIAQNGTVLFERSYGQADSEKHIPNTLQTRFRIASITKQFTAVAILMLQEQGRLSVDDSVCQYIPDCPESWKSIKIHNLLTHTAGLYDFRDFAYNQQTGATPSTSAQVIARIKEQPLSYTPGTDWRYSNGNFMVAGYVVERVSGQPYAQFLQEHIFNPVGMKNTGYAKDDTGLAVGYDVGTTPAIRLDGTLPYAAAGLYSTVEDLYMYSQALEGGRLVSQKSLNALFGLHSLVGSVGVFSPTFQVPVYYGYGWAIAKYNGHRMIGHDAWIEGYSGDIRLFPDDQVTLILLENRTDRYAPLVDDEILPILFR